MMRVQRFLLESCLCLLLLNALLGVGARHAIVPRQDAPKPTNNQIPPTTTDPFSKTGSESNTQITSPSAAATTLVPKSSETHNEAPKATSPSKGSSTSDGSASSTSSVDPSVLTASPLPDDHSTGAAAASQPQSEDLPINPTITPALSVAGAILMVTGLFYTLIGIKTKWLHIFLSAAYLTSLAVTVLIVYVMHPPVSNAIQGAYFAAACVTGLVFGGGSVLFADVTEGLGCLLGGFSLAMWFLVLVPGGLIHSTAGKAIFIACFTLGSFGFYVSHWTRAYGMIGATSFAGATVIVLGIDCFSRAGLKEFWLYIWDLNDKIFPLHYTARYPITRGIRVEIAAIVIGFLIGVMSQMKIWKVIKRKREQRATERLRQEKLQEQAEEDLGRKIEEGNVHDRSLWEVAYNGQTGGNRHVDSGIGTEAPSPRKGSSSIFRSSRVTGPRASIELEDLEGGNKSTEEASRSGGKDKTRATVTVRIASDDDILQTDPMSALAMNAPGSGSPLPGSPSPNEDDPSHSNPSREGKASKASSSPKVVPLPFEVPMSDPDGDRRSSLAASIASDHFSTRLLKRLSGSSLKRTSSKRSQRSYIVTSTSEEALMIPHSDKDDRPSSVAANVDEISDGQDSEADATTLAVLPSPAAEESRLLKFSPPMEPHPMDRPGHKISKMSLGQASFHTAPRGDEEAPENSTTKLQSTTGDAQLDEPRSAEPVVLGCDEHAKPDVINEEFDTSSAPQHVAEKPALQERLADLHGASKVVMAYRTNEWAKHLGAAEKPSVDDLRSTRQEEPAIAVPTEKAVPVNIPALQQTAMDASPAPVIPPPNLTSSTTKFKDRSISTNSQDPLNHYPFPQRKTSASSFDRTSSQSSLDSLPSQRGNRNSQPNLGVAQPTRQSNPSRPSVHRTKKYRSSSTPLLQSPIEEDIPSTTFPQRFALPTNNTLMSHRQSMLQTRPSSTSLTYTPAGAISRMPSNEFNTSGLDIH
ncbi:MAG: hypothetical protein Q9218_006332, partial [Villophora microphyllina]